MFSHRYGDDFRRLEFVCGGFSEQRQKQHVKISVKLSESADRKLFPISAVHPSLLKTQRAKPRMWNRITGKEWGLHGEWQKEILGIKWGGGGADVKRKGQEQEAGRGSQTDKCQRELHRPSELGSPSQNAMCKKREAEALGQPFPQHSNEITALYNTVCVRERGRILSSLRGSVQFRWLIRAASKRHYSHHQTRRIEEDLPAYLSFLTHTHRLTHTHGRLPFTSLYLQPHKSRAEADFYQCGSV